MSSSSEPPDEVLTITSAEQYRALGHPLRHRLLFALGQHPATISQLAVALDSHKGNIAHHLKVLREAGLVAVTETRQVRGGTEQYYQRTARRLRLSRPAGYRARRRPAPGRRRRDGLGRRGTVAGAA